MKKLIFLALLLGAFSYWKGWKVPGFGNPVLSQPKNKTVVIEYSDDQDLLNQLRKVDTGRQIEIRQKPQETTMTSTGIACDDEAGKKAFMENKNRELEQLNKDIDIEIKRIQRIQ